jgi:hypothetical protein
MKPAFEPRMYPQELRLMPGSRRVHEVRQPSRDRETISTVGVARRAWLEAYLGGPHGSDRGRRAVMTRTNYSPPPAYGSNVPTPERSTPGRGTAP